MVYLHLWVGGKAERRGSKAKRERKTRKEKRGCGIGEGSQGGMEEGMGEKGWRTWSMAGL